MDTGAQGAAIGALIEQLAAIEHERWADWQSWCHKVLREHCPSPSLELVLARWDRQIATPYADLSEAERESDREQVRRYLPLIQEALDAAAARHASLVALAHELVELEHGARRGQMQALNRLGIVLLLDEHWARARAFTEQQHARIDALAALGEGGA